LGHLTAGGWLLFDPVQTAVCSCAGLARSQHWKLRVVQSSTGSIRGEIRANEGRRVSRSMSTGLWVLQHLDQPCHIQNSIVCESYEVVELNTVINHLRCFASNTKNEHSFISSQQRS
jgi:hypothetical protein